jgi:hypothetical protein
LENQVLSVTYADYFSGSTPYGEIAHAPGAPYNHDTLVVILDRRVGGYKPVSATYLEDFIAPGARGSFGEYALE